MNNILNKIKPIHILIIFIIICLSMISYFIYQKIDQSGKIQITINLVPKDSKVIVGNQEYKNGLNYIKSGEYKITVKKDGFITKTLTQNLLTETDEINVSLVAQSDEAKKWASNNKSVYSEFESLVDKNTQQKGVNFLANNPITKYLPFKNYLYSIGSKLDSSDKTGNSIIITINSSEQYRQSAISQIERWGFNIADFNIEFNDFTNPFKI